MVFLKNVLKKIIVKKISRLQNKMEKFPSRQSLKLGSLNIKMHVSKYEENVHCFLII